MGRKDGQGERSEGTMPVGNIKGGNEMLTTYRTKSITDNNRPNIPTGSPFDECEECGCITHRLDGKSNKSVRFYERHKQALCDECVDRKNGQPWR